MPVLDRRNAFDNPGFRLWDYGTSANLATLPTNGYLANRWKILNNGFAGNVVKGTTSADALVPKWLRSKPCLQVAVTGYGTSMQVRQTIEDGQTYARSIAVLSLVVFGTAGTRFRAGMNGQYRIVTCSGTDQPTTVNLPFMLPDLAATTLDVDIFATPLSTGTYYIPFAQLSIGEQTGKVEPPTLPRIDTDIDRTARYSRAIGRGLVGRATSATRIVIPMNFARTMRQTPTFQSTSTSAGAVAISTGTGSTAATATYTWANGSPDGGRLVVDGFTGLTTGDSYLFTTTQLGVLHADY